MKQLLVIMLLTIGAVAQEKTYQVPESQLTEQQKAKLEGATPKNVSEWVGLGKEVGTAVDASLGAISNRTNEFAQTPVGKLTVAVVIFKVIGDTAVHLLAGAAEVVILLPLWVWSYRRFLPKPTIKETFSESGKRLTITKTPPDRTTSDQDNWLTAHYFFLALLAIVILTTIFSY